MAFFAEPLFEKQRPGGMKHRIVCLNRRPLEIGFGEGFPGTLEVFPGRRQLAFAKFACVRLSSDTLLPQAPPKVFPHPVPFLPR